MLVAGDFVKVDLGVHIDGYIAVAAQTYKVVESGDAVPIHDTLTGAEKATDAMQPTVEDVISAAYVAMDVAVRLIAAGNTNTQVNKKSFRCTVSLGT